MIMFNRFGNTFFPVPMNFNNIPGFQGDQGVAPSKGLKHTE